MRARPLGGIWARVPLDFVLITFRMTGSAEVLEALYPLLLKHGKPEFIRSDNVLYTERNVI